MRLQRLSTVIPAGIVVALLALVVIAAAPVTRAEARGLRLGFMQDEYFELSPEPFAGRWFDRARDVRADIVRFNIRWSTVAPRRPPNASAAVNPAWTGYDWSAPDRAIRLGRSRGVAVLVNVQSAPSWAEGARRSSSAPAGSWRPDPVQLDRFARAVARRYSGTYPDPAGGALPRAAAFQAWNEPNLPTYLSPQWDGRGRAASPAMYRRLLNSFFDGVKAVDRSATVVTAGTAPYGDPPSMHRRMMPARFWRELLCLARACRDKAKFDVISHHPYSVGSPGRHALNADDISVPDLGKLTTLLHRAEGRHTISGRHKRLWITELSWDSSPPDPNGVPADTHARWLEESAYRLWRQGAETLVWLNVGDQAPGPSFERTYQSGVYFIDGRPKPAATAFRFPFVTDCTKTSRGRRCVAWGKTSAGATVTIERITGSGARRVSSARTGRDGLFLKSIPFRGRGTLRARTATDTSLNWTQR